MTEYNWNEKHIVTFPEEEVVLSTKGLHVYYGKNESIKGVDMQFKKNKITALIGPSGSGKSTYLRSLNRMNDTIDIAKVDALCKIVNALIRTIFFTLFYNSNGCSRTHSLNG